MVYFFTLGFIHVFTKSGFAAELAGCQWTEAVSKKKKLWIQIYLNTCGQGLRGTELTWKAGLFLVSISFLIKL